MRYEAVNAMLLNEFLKEHRKVEEQKRKIESQQHEGQEQGSRLTRQDRKVQELEAIVAQSKSALKEQAAQIHKVTEQLQASRPETRLVSNDE